MMMSDGLRPLRIIFNKGSLKSSQVLLNNHEMKNRNENEMKTVPEQSLGGGCRGHNASDCTCSIRNQFGQY